LGNGTLLGGAQVLNASVVREFGIPAEDLWELIGDFGNMAKWSGTGPESCVQDGEGIGSLRTITLANGQKIVDRLEASDDLRYTYSIVSSSLPFSSYRATMAVAPVGTSRSQLTWSGEFEPKGITDAEAIEATEGMYHYGISLMEKTIARRK
jgi:hypothetical protein